MTELVSLSIVDHLLPFTESATLVQFLYPLPLIPTTAKHSALVGGVIRQVGLTMEEPRNWNSMMEHRIDHVRNLMPSAVTGNAPMLLSMNLS